MSSQLLQRNAIFHLLSLLGTALLAASIILPRSAMAQTGGPSLEVKQVDSSNAPDYTMKVTVVGPDGSVVSGLGSEAFALTDAVSNSPIPIAGVQTDNAGIATMIVADLGGLDNTRDFGARNVENVEQLARQFMQAITANSGGKDYAGLIIATGTGADKLGVTVPPTIDLNSVTNELEQISQLPVEKTSALFDGLNRALNLLARNPDAATRDALQGRRKLIVLFSDGADDKFSDEGIRGDILRRANEAGVSIFAVQVNQRTPKEFANMNALAAQTNGGYTLFDSSVDQAAAEQQVRDLFNRIDSQRSQYALAYRNIKPAGEYTARLTVTTPNGSDSADARYTSNLQPPTVRLTAPGDSARFVQRSAAPAAPITLTAEVQFPDGKPRSVGVEFFVNGSSIQRVDAPPYQVTWQPPKEDRTVVTKTVPFAFQAEVIDSFTGERASSPSVKTELQVASVPAVPFVPTEAPPPEEWLRQNLALVAGLCGLGVVALGLIAALIVMNRRYSDQFAVMRANMAKGVAGGIRMVTQRLGLSKQPVAELKVVGGPMMGMSLPVGADSVWVGRDPSQCEVVLLSDPYVSSKHFNISRDPSSQQFFITDEGTANGTRLNRVPLPMKVRTPLPQDAEIEAGMTKMVFQTGRKTQRLN
jgi:hypothetical protein